MPYVKTSVRTTRSGAVRYLQLAHNEWDPQAGRSRTRVLYNFGREDELDRDAVRRLVAALSRLLDPAEALAAAEPGELTVTGSRPAAGSTPWTSCGGAWGWRMRSARRWPGAWLSPETERALFALVANRALAASSKLAAAGWISGDVHVDGLPETSDDACYRAMDHLLEIEPGLAEQAYYQLTDLLNLEVDLLFFDTTSTYFETEQEDADVPRDERGERVPAGSKEEADQGGFRAFGKSKDSRDDLPQVIVGMAVTRDGIPVRVWSWPGDTGDSGLIRQVKQDLRGWALSKVIWVADRGFTSRKNRRALMQGGGGYIIGEKLRTGSKEVKAVLSRQGRYKTVRDNLQVKEVRLGDDSDRFIICYNPGQAERDAAIRARLVAQLGELIDGTDALTAAERARIEGTLAGKPGLKQFLRVTPAGLPRIDKARIKAEENLDGKYLLRSSDPHLTSRKHVPVTAGAQVHLGPGHEATEAPPGHGPAAVLAVAGSAPLTSAHRVLRSPSGLTATFTLATNAACESASQRASREAMLLPEGDEHRLQRLELGQFLPSHDLDDRLPLPLVAGNGRRVGRGGDATPGSVFTRRRHAARVPGLACALPSPSGRLRLTMQHCGALGSWLRRQ